MNKSGNITSTALLVLSALMLFLFYRGNSKLNDATKTIKDVSIQITLVKDSLQSAQKSILNVLKKLEFAENELNIIRTERELIDLEAKKSKARTYEELQFFKQEIKKFEEKKSSLIEIAKEFEL
jgi:uncharacterized protein (DUF3084 family)